jgi:hypothetical protein
MAHKLTLLASHVLGGGSSYRMIWQSGWLVQGVEVVSTKDICTRMVCWLRLFSKLGSSGAKLVKEESAIALLTCLCFFEDQAFPIYRFENPIHRK